MSVITLSRESSRVARLKQFLRNRPGNLKHVVMRCTGFDKIDGLTEHVAFESALLKLNAELREVGECVVREDNHFSIGALAKRPRPLRPRYVQLRGTVR